MSTPGLPCPRHAQTRAGTGPGGRDAQTAPGLRVQGSGRVARPPSVNNGIVGVDDKISEAPSVAWRKRPRWGSKKQDRRSRSIK